MAYDDNELLIAAFEWVNRDPGILREFPLNWVALRGPELLYDDAGPVASPDPQILVRRVVDTAIDIEDVFFHFVNLVQPIEQNR